METDIQQQKLFDDEDLRTIGIDECAARLAISTATVRNWIKAGLLESPRRGVILLSSARDFEKNVAGTQKLVQRANKSQKAPTNSDAPIRSDFLYTHSHLPGDELASAYEISLSESVRNLEGVYYTPRQIAVDLISKIGKVSPESTFCDPCCGTGNFLIEALNAGFKPQNIFGFDTDPVAVEIARKRLIERCGQDLVNVIHADFLKEASHEDPRKFDVVATNPPWGKKLPSAEKMQFAEKLASGNATDSCSLFFFACLKSLADDGKLALLLPESFFAVAAHESARKRLLSYRVNSLVDFGRPFPTLMTRAMALIMENRFAEENWSIRCRNGEGEYYRTSQSFSDNPKSIINFTISDQDSLVIKRIYATPHTTLSGKARWGIGIVTGNNKKYVRDVADEGFIPVYRGADILPDGEMRQPSAFISEDLSLYQQVAPLPIFLAKPKLIYKFISSRLVFHHDTEAKFVLNSANILVLNDAFQMSMKKLAELLNSDFMSWVFRSIFHSTKVLRSDLEALPIHTSLLNDKPFSESDYLESLGIEKAANGTYRVKK